MSALGFINDDAMTAVKFVDGDVLTARQETAAVRFCRAVQTKNSCMQDTHSRITDNL